MTRKLGVIALSVVGPLVASAAVDCAFLKGLLEIPSVSADAAAVNRAVDLTRSWLEKNGVRCQVETNAAGRTALYASTRPGKVQDYLLVTHLDVVPAGPEQFKPRFEGDRVYARGANDCKGNAVLAAQVLRDLNGKASVGAVFAGDEEIGGFTTKMMVERGYGAKKLIVILDAGTYGVFYAEKGNYYFRVRAVGRGGHSSAAPWLMNPIDRLADGYLKFMAAWPKVPADGWGDVISATLVSAGEAENRIPDTAEMTLNLRSVSADAPERAVKLLKEVGGLEVVRVDESAKPVTSDVNDPEIVRFLAARKAFWPEKKPGFQRMLAATDARHFTACGVPIVITGVMGANAHAQGEWQDLKSIDENAEMLKQYFAPYARLRKELRAFYPDECHGLCKDPRQTNSVAAINCGLDAWAAAHPGFDALDLRRESYLLMRQHFVPFLFGESPFYFEAGVNGGWSIWSGDRVVPSRHVNALCNRFYKEKGLIPAEAFSLLYDRMGSGRLLVCCGPFSDDMHHVPPFHAIFTKGFKGVREEVAAALANCPADDPLGRKELETALVGLDTIHEIQLKFAAEAKGRLKDGGAPGGRPLPANERHNLERIADAAGRCPWEPPRTFYEGLNTLWFVREILGYVDGVSNFSLGRPDAWLIDFYRADLAAGRLTKDEARELVAKFLIVSDCHLDDRLFLDRPSDQEAEMPLTLGGASADGTFVWNELTEMFLDEHLKQDLVFPKLHCRISKDAPQAYLAKIGDMLMHDHAVFALFNDDRHIPNFLALGVPSGRVHDYVCTGCWDGNVDTYTDVDCANYVSVARILEMTIHRNPEEERRYKVKIDPIDGANDFAEVEETVYRNFIRFFREVLGEYTRYGCANAQIFPHPAYSMCLDGCIASRRDTTDGGAAFRPRVVTLAFMANVVDSLCAIRKVCFEDRQATLGEFLEAVRTNWAGEKGRRLRALAMSAPYWGDNTEPSTAMMRRWLDRIHADIADLRNDQGGPYVLACWIYREFVNWGAQMKATPDGRRDGDRLAQGFAPSEFRCKESASAVIGALGKLDHGKLYASNANLMFEKESVTPELFAAIFRVACESGMHLLQPNCTSVADLLDAQAHPERHQNIIVKVCGFSARFVTLSKRWQDEIIARHRLR